MDPRSWREMVERTRELEYALGRGVKKVEANEAETVILQRRSVRAARDLERGAALQRDDLVALRPCPPDALPPFRIPQILGKRVSRAIRAGDHLRWTDLETVAAQ